MMPTLPRPALWLCLLFVSLAGHAVGALKVGDPAPRPKVGSWAQGEAIEKFEGDQVYIVEFWATWCGPCIQAIPHINEISERHKDAGLVVIGQNLGEDEATVKAFIKKMGSKMKYRVAVDDAAGTMDKTWLKAAGQNGIPCAFVVNKQGKIAYIGHPMALEEDLLKKLLAEPFTKAPEESKAGAPAAPSARTMELAGRAKGFLQAGRLEEAAETIATLNKAVEPAFSYLGGILEMERLLRSGDAQAALKMGELLAADFPDDGVVGTMAAEVLATVDGADAATLEKAVPLATPATIKDGPARSTAFAVIARIAFRGGDAAEAIDLQKKAVAAAAEAEKSAAEAALKAYQDGRLP